MQIKFTSTLTSEDENRLAPALIEALGQLLGLLPLAYSVRIETIDGSVFQGVGPGAMAGSGLSASEASVREKSTGEPPPVTRITRIPSE